MHYHLQSALLLYLALTLRQRFSLQKHSLNLNSIPQL